MTNTFDPNDSSDSERAAETADEMAAFEAQFPPDEDAIAHADESADVDAEAGAEAEAEAVEGSAPVADADALASDETDADGAELGDAEVIEIEEIVEPEPSPFDRPGRWYVVHTYAGYENKVKSNLASRVRSMNVEDRIYEVVIPMEDVIEFKNGRKVVVQKKVFPGYLLVRMGLDDDAWYVVRNTPGVTGFVGSGAKPTPLSRREVEDILGTGEKIEGPAAEKKVRPRLEYEVAEQVRVVTGPFADFNGVISEIDVDRSKLKVLVNIFGRETPVELEFADVAKL
jgi:transcriptional antiterminator NusG